MNKKTDSNTKRKILLDQLCSDSSYLKMSGDETFECLLCTQSYTCKKRQGQRPILEHLNTEKHKEAVNSAKHKEISFVEMTEREKHVYVLKWMLKNNEPLSRLDNPDFNCIFKDLFNFVPFSSSHYRKNFLSSLYENYINDVFKNFENKNFFLMFDETPDSRSRKILNILIGELDAETYKKAILIDTIELNKTDSANISVELNYIIVKLTKSAKNKDRFKVLISDKAAYAIKTGEILKTFYPKMIHVTCFCHGLHNFSSFI